ALLVADSWEGMWTPLTFARLLDQPADIRLCVDIVPLDRAWTEQRVEFVAVSAENRMRDPNAPRDVKAEGALTTARQFQEQADQGFFALRAVVAVGARDRARLEEAVRAVSLSMRSVLRLIRPNGGQGRLVSFFSDTATDDINAFAPARTDVGKGAAVSLPIGIRRPAATDGILWMLEGQTPIFFHPVLDEHGRKRAGHVVVLGLPGNGKTTAAFAWALRLATALNGQVIFVEPNEHASRLVERAGAAGVYHRLDLSQRINILDVAVGRDPDGRPPPVSAQIQVVLTQLSVLLGRAGINAQQQQTFEPRVLNEMQLSLLDLALQAVYAPWADKLDELRPEETPILSDLVAALRALTIPSEVEHDRARLVAELEMRLVQGSLGSTYNARSTVQWDFQHDLTAFNLTALAEGVPRILYTFQLFAAITRYARGRPDPERPLFVFFDEFGASLRGIPGLAAFVLDCMKVLRTFLTAVIAMDQLWSTFKDQPLRAIWEAAAIHVYFAQQLENAKEIVSAEDALSEEFAPVIARQGLGECVMVWNPTAAEGGGATEVFQGRVQLSPEELLHLPEPRPTRAGTR
ncbi:MAG TPA: hypothetical protein VFS21_19865, partial [Roseiflexaceae bacterium]|nr:hypothetical protein [Roseiflexaceae bacterium]